MRPIEYRCVTRAACSSPTVITVTLRRSILHDEQVYPDALTFKPERFLKSDEGTLVLNPDVLDPADVVFGFGRRVCPGQHMVYDTMWIAIATMLVCLEIGKAKDKFGKEIEVAEEFVSRFVT